MNKVTLFLYQRIAVVRQVQSWGHVEDRTGWNLRWHFLEEMNGNRL